MEEQKILNGILDDVGTQKEIDAQEFQSMVDNISPNGAMPEAKVLDGKKADAMASNITNAMSYDKSQYLYPKDVRSLKQHKYDVIAERFDKGYVIRNTKTGQIVELRAATACHAATMINWRHRQVEVLDIIQHAKVVETKPIETKPIEIKVESTVIST